MIPKLEQMAYKMQPAGHEEPAPRRNFGKPDSKLAQVFERWIENARVHVGAMTNYELLGICDSNLQPTLEELHSIVLHYQDHPKRQEIGLFLSYYFNKSPEEVICYELDTDWMTSLGYRLPGGKTLVNLGKTGPSFGYQAHGILINAGEAGYTAGTEIEAEPQLSRGYCSFINLNKIGTYVGSSSDTLLVNLSNADLGFGTSAKGAILNFGSCGAQLASSTHYPCMLINDGKSYLVGHNSSGLLISTTQTHFGNTEHARRVFKQNECEQIPELVKYVGNLRAMFEPAKNDWKKALEAVKQLGPNAHNKIKQDVEEILWRANYDTR